MKSNLSNLVQQVNQIDAYAQETTEVLANAIVKSRNEATETKESLLTKISDADGEAKRATSAAKDAVVKADEVVRAGIDTVTKATEQAVSEVRKETEQSFKTQAEFNAAQAQAIQDRKSVV